MICPYFPDTYKTRVVERKLDNGVIRTTKRLFCQVQIESKPSTIKQYTWSRNGKIISQEEDIVIDRDNLLFEVNPLQAMRMFATT